MIYLGKNILHELLDLKGIIAKFPINDNATKSFSCHFKVLFCSSNIKTYLVERYIIENFNFNIILEDYKRRKFIPETYLNIICSSLWNNALIYRIANLTSSDGICVWVFLLSKNSPKIDWLRYRQYGTEDPKKFEFLSIRTVSKYSNVIM